MAPATRRFVAAAVAASSAWALEPNPPVWPSTVKVFGPETPLADITSAVNYAYSVNGGQNPSDHGQFSKSRFAFLFKPGQYNVEVPVGYYTTVAGLGTSPGDVLFTSAKGVYCEEASFSVSPGALDTFWRGAENFATNANYAWNNNGLPGMIWAASQASPLRRIIVNNNLQLYEYVTGGDAAGFASGGFMANMQVKGTVASGSQQQFLSRHSAVGDWVDGVWNMVFVGVQGAPESHCGANTSLCSHPYTTVSTGTVAEKPFISIDSTGKYHLNIPSVTPERSSFDFGPAVQVGFEHVYVASAADSAATINAKLAQGLHVVLSPGIYNLEASLQLNTAGQVLLGLGLATLVAANGQPAITVGNVDGVRIASVLLEAGTQPTSALLVWGDGSHAGTAANPGIFHDLFARVGGPAVSSGQPQANAMAVINSGNVIGDNMWLWRADHTETGLVYASANPCLNALIVNGNDVIMYGLKAEHALQDLVQWNGERGVTYFFQAEFPYDVTQANYGDKGYVAYRVKSTVTTHLAYGIGVYHYFRDAAVVVQSAISVPAALESSIIAPLSVYLNGLGTVKHVINDKGAASLQPAGTGANPKWYCPAATLPWWNLGATCNVGDPVTCPGTTVGCKGNTCCPDGSTCPSAMPDFGCCPKPKTQDCTGGGPSPSPSPSPAPTPTPTPTPPPPSPSPSPTPTPPTPTCKVGDTVSCPRSTVRCQGDQCCPDGSTCPSADNSWKGCPSPKAQDCTTAVVWYNLQELLEEQNQQEVADETKVVV